MLPGVALPSMLAVASVPGFAIVFIPAMFALGGGEKVLVSSPPSSPSKAKFKAKS